jgi:hypothetical protein
MKYILLLILFILLYTNSNNLVKIKSTNNKFYYTQKTHSLEASYILILLENFINKLCNYLIKDNFNNKYLKNKLKKNIIIKEIPNKYKNYISYLSNKKIIYICLRKNKNEFETNMNALYFIIMHELSHIITITDGHTKEFWDNNKLIINTATKYKLYKYKNYYKYPVYICNKIINSLPI